ncbi:MAG: squalene synthase HpnC [Gaiellaceae bacterium]
MAASRLDSRELSLRSIDRQAGGENFPVASLLAPRAARPHLRAIYGFARLVDNIGDEAEGDRLALLDDLEVELEACYRGAARTPHMQRLQVTIAEKNLPREPFRRLIEANRIDQRQDRYESWEDVRWYCMHSADPVGRLVLGIYDRLDQPDLVSMSDSVCTGLQLVNFLQDPPRDLALGRVYLPLEDLKAHGVRTRELGGPVTDRFRGLMRFEAARAADLLEPGIELGRELKGRIGASVALFARGGMAALEALERADWDVFSQRPAPSKWTFARLTLRQLLNR